MDDLHKEDIECDECFTQFTVSYTGKNEPMYCPFCGELVDLGEEVYDDEDWDE